MQTGVHSGGSCGGGLEGCLLASRNCPLSSQTEGVGLSAGCGDLPKGLLNFCDCLCFLICSSNQSNCAHSCLSINLDCFLSADFLHLKLQLMSVFNFGSFGFRKRKRLFFAFRMPLELTPSPYTRRFQTYSTKAKYSSSERLTFRNSSSSFTRSSQKGFDLSISLQMELRLARYFLASDFFFLKCPADSGSNPKYRQQKLLTSHRDSSGWYMTQVAMSVIFFCQNLLVPPISSTSLLANSIKLMFFFPAMECTQTSRKLSSSSQVQLQRRYSFSSSSLPSKEEEGSIWRDSQRSLITRRAFFSQLGRSQRQHCRACSWGVIIIQIVRSIVQG